MHASNGAGGRRPSAAPRGPATDHTGASRTDGPDGAGRGSTAVAARQVRWTPRWTGDARAFVDELIGWLVSVGREPSVGGGTWLDHALGTADRARLDGARDELVVAALLHDVGAPLAARIDASGESLAVHEHLGAAWLARFFPSSVTEPIRLHVTAGRWLLATEPGFAESLQPDAGARLGAAGGPLTKDERDGFETDASAAAALALCRWRCAVSEGRPAPSRVRPAPLDAYRDTLVRLVRARR